MEKKVKVTCSGVASIPSQRKHVLVVEQEVVPKLEALLTEAPNASVRMDLRIHGVAFDLAVGIVPAHGRSAMLHRLHADEEAFRTVAQLTEVEAGQLKEIRDKLRALAKSTKVALPSLPGPVSLKLVAHSGNTGLAPGRPGCCRYAFKPDTRKGGDNPLNL